ncbi:MAG: MBL fold metallo-hydrolase [Bacteroidia bacterium]|nr:MBL fold metallo-hydrolase [Bacteroidia bacterium]
MVIRFLGTGTSQGVPLIGCNCEVCTSTNTKDKRLRSSVFIEHNGTQIVIDTGTDFRQQMLRENINHIDGIVYTHEHKDHLAGMDDIRAFNFKTRKAVNLYATERVQNAIRAEFAYVFEIANYTSVPQINFNTISHQNNFNVENITLTPIQVMHAKMPVLGFRVGNFTYITDANYISETELQKIKGTDVLVLNALRREDHVSHFNLQQALNLVELIKPRIAYFTHISHQLGTHNDVNNELPSNVFLAYDGLIINV